jgi:hypothetical protein
MSKIYKSSLISQLTSKKLSSDCIFQLSKFSQIILWIYCNIANFALSIKRNQAIASSLESCIQIYHLSFKFPFQCNVFSNDNGDSTWKVVQLENLTLFVVWWFCYWIFRSYCLIVWHESILLSKCTNDTTMARSKIAMYLVVTMHY